VAVGKRLDKRAVRVVRQRGVERAVRDAIFAVRQVDREVLTVDRLWLGAEDPNGGSMKSRAMALPGHLAAVIVYGETDEIVEARMQRLLRGWELAGRDER
jgi:hypothetical protein